MGAFEPATFSAPGRASIIGNPTDMYGGSVVSCTLEERARATLESSDTTVLEVCDRQARFSGDEPIPAMEGDEVDAARAVLAFFLQADPSDPPNVRNLWRMADTRLVRQRVLSRPFRLTAHTQIPIQAGLGGSTAIVAVILACCLQYLDISLNPYQMAEATRWVEANILGVSCGYQDHYMTVFGGLNYLDMRGKEMHRQDESEPFATVELLADLIPELPFVVAHTGVKRDSSSVHGSIRPRWLAGEEKVIRGYERISEIGRLGKKALVEGDWERLGCLMNENHTIQRDLGGSGPSNEALIQAALDGGALGAKLAGAGHGGTIIALHREPRGLASRLLSCGAHRIIALAPAPGLTPEPIAAAPLLGSASDGSRAKGRNTTARRWTLAPGRAVFAEDEASPD